MQPTRRSSQLLKLKDVEIDPPYLSDPAQNTTHGDTSETQASSRKRQRRRDTRTVSPPPLDPEIESLSDDEPLDEEVPDEPPVPEDTAENRSKEQRYEESRSVYATKAEYYPELMQPSFRRPMTPRFLSLAAAERYQDLRGRKFINQQSLNLADENLGHVRRVVTEVGLIHTLTDVDPYQPNVVREFLANLLEAEERDDGVAVYVRGSLVDFSPSLINALYCILGFEEDPDWRNEGMDEVCGFLTDGRIRRWENMSSKYLSATNQVLYKLVCSNWIPTMNYTSMNQERLRFVYMLHHYDGFDFGKLIYKQIMAMAENTKKNKKTADWVSHLDSASHPLPAQQMDFTC